MKLVRHITFISQ